MNSINIEAENEHFLVGDSVISWMETCKAMMSAQNVHNPRTPLLQSQDNDNNETGLVGLNQQLNVDIDTKPNIDNIVDIVTLSSLNLKHTLPAPSIDQHQLSAPSLAWELIKLFGDITGISSSNQILRDKFIYLTSNCDQNNQRPISKSPVHGDNESIISHTSSLQQPTPQNQLNGLDISSNFSTFCQLGGDPGPIQVRMRGDDEWAPPRAQIIFIVHEEASFRGAMVRQSYRCAGCGSKIDLDLARRLVSYCHYLGKYFCKCCFSHKSINLPGYILQKWDFHKYPVSHFALQLLDRISNEPLFNINDINPTLYKKIKKLRNLIDIRLQLYYLKIYISTCQQAESLMEEYSSFSHQHLLKDDLHLYSLNNLIEIQHGKLYEYLDDLVTRSISHVAQCDRCRAKGHYCQLCGPSSLVSSLISNNQANSEHNRTLKHSSSFGKNISAAVGSGLGHIMKPFDLSSFQLVTPVASTTSMQHSSKLSPGGTTVAVSLACPVKNMSVAGDMPIGTTSSTTSQSTTSAAANMNTSMASQAEHELIFPFEVNRVAQCQACGCCFHLQCFIDAGQNCPKCERIQRRKAEVIENNLDFLSSESSSHSSGGGGGVTSGLVGSEEPGQSTASETACERPRDHNNHDCSEENDQLNL